MPDKTDWPSILGPGFHELAISDLERLFVDPFPDQPRRKELCNGLKQFLSILALLPLRCQCWIGGSFITKKPTPADVDVVLFFNRGEIDDLDDASYAVLKELCDRAIALARYFCDVYYDPSDEPQRQDYWRKKFGFTSDEATEKGIVLIKINHG